MNRFFSCTSAFLLSILGIIIFLNLSPVLAADGKKWDGKTYPFKLLDPSKPNSESNPFIIDTAGKLGYLSWLAGRSVDMDFNIVAYGKKNGLKGLNNAFKDNFVKLTADLDMNGSKFELRSIDGGVINFDGGGHVIDNLRISDKTTPVKIDSQQGTVEMYLGLFQDAESIKNLGIGKGSRITFHGGTRYTNSVWAAGIAANAYKIDNCYSDATITIKGEGDSFIAGVAAECGYLTNSYHRGSIIVNGKIINSFMKNKQNKSVPGELRVGGVCARADKLISGCYNTGSVNVTSSGTLIEIGGVSADHNICVCSDLFNTGNIRLKADGDIRNGYVGGVIGFGLTYGLNPRWKLDGYTDYGIIYNKGSIDVSVITGNVISVGGVGGGAGERGTSFSTGFYEMSGAYGFVNTYNSGQIYVSSTGKAELNAGGIAGYGAMVINSYNTGKISGTSGTGAKLNLGGIGGSGIYVQNSYNIGQVSAKGAGTNIVGGVTGNSTKITWGETKTSLSSMLHGFWLRQSKPGGINKDIKYGKGSYFYMRKGDIKKNALGTVLDALSKDDPNEMVEDTFGVVYTFDSPSSSVMMRSDDAAGKRKNLEGTLLYNLNEMVEDKLDRLYRRWIIDGSNGGYPVLSSKPTVYSRTSEKPDTETASKIAGQYLGVHMKWNDTIMFNADGTFKRTLGGDGGTWSYNGTRLILRWTKWTPEILKQKPTGEFSSNVYSFTLMRSDSLKTTEKPDAAIVNKIAGEYSAQHKADWSGTLIINKDGTFKVVEGGDGGTWSFDGKKLILNWSKWAPEILEQKSEGVFSASAYKFTLKRKVSSVSKPSSSETTATTPIADKPVSTLMQKVSGTYYTVHKDWTDSLTLNSDGTFKRGNGNSGTWTFDGRKLILKWNNTGIVETLVTSSVGFSCLTYKFTMRK